VRHAVRPQDFKVPGVKVVVVADFHRVTRLARYSPEECIEVIEEHSAVGISCLGEGAEFNDENRYAVPRVWPLKNQAWA
jgi:hypothetical protein